MTLISQRALNRAYLARQMLLARERVTALQAVERLVAMQAQVARPPFIGLWTRLHGFGRSELAQALHARTAVRVTSLRGTLHVMTTADYIALRGALQPMLTRGTLAILRDRAGSLDMDALDVEARKFFRKSAATFDALRDHLKTKFPTQDERAMAYAIRTHLPLVQVPTDATWGFPASADFALADTFSWGIVGQVLSVSFGIRLPIAFDLNNLAALTALRLTAPPVRLAFSFGAGSSVRGSAAGSSTRPVAGSSAYRRRASSGVSYAVRIRSRLPNSSSPNACSVAASAAIAGR